MSIAPNAGVSTVPMGVVGIVDRKDHGSLLSMKSTLRNWKLARTNSLRWMMSLALWTPVSRLNLRSSLRRRCVCVTCVSAIRAVEYSLLALPDDVLGRAKVLGKPTAQ